MAKTLSILGIRGVPAQHGGFETFAARLAPYLVRQGWDVTVYCQHEGNGKTYTDYWNGVMRVNIFVPSSGAASTLVFDWKSIWHVAKMDDPYVLTLGYNSALLCLYLRLRGIKNVINMDGIEWARSKWNKPTRAWFWLNEHIGSRIGNHLIADHPEIKSHLQRSVKSEKISVIPYGADDMERCDESLIHRYGIEKNQYGVVIARPEPENSLLEIVQSFSRQKRGKKLVVLGKFERTNEYHNSVLNAASDEVIFPGAIYEVDVVAALRSCALFYVHGHTVGGTNPSLVEAMGAGNAVIAHDNKFNRWVVGDGAMYFTDEDSCALAMENLMGSDTTLLELKRNSKRKFESHFTWVRVLAQYEFFLEKFAQTGEGMSQLEADNSFLTHGTARSAVVPPASLEGKPAETSKTPEKDTEIS